VCGKKAAPAKAPKAEKSGGGSGKAKKKWSKGKAKEKLNNAVVFDKATYDKLVKEVPAYKLITPYIVSDRLKISGSLAIKGIRDLHAKGLIRKVIHSHSQVIYTRSSAAVQAEKEKAEKAEKEKAEKPAAEGKKPAAKKGAAPAKAAAEEPAKDKE